ncbi:uncharacterized protein LOC132551507 [Ylistrum balloti]|uniref:uncharacterized protein LOC132551507 n=1 Tax=Ylistrum balloti TaxID=509963 RepID=UPI0029059EA8|nr:uncharacterized protein LOC132551507 [Ylistrum balloti]XP_060071642.1 uncharacterized protein LOC132551507 [Ylistrum balloti]
MEETRDQVIQSELAQVKQKAPVIEGITLVTCVELSVRLGIKVTDQKHVTLIVMFPPKYPHEPIIMELKSKTLSEKLLDGLLKVCEQQAKKWVGQRQILLLTNFVLNFLHENPLCVCSDEIQTVKKDLLTSEDSLKLKQKTSEIGLKIRQDNYYMNIRIGIPEGYPAKQVTVEVDEHNYPDLLKTNFAAQAIEIARRCVQAPIKKKPKDPPFQVKPSLFPVCKFLIQDSLKKYPRMMCPLCKEQALPTNPSEKQTDPRKNVERVYCGHLFHFGCLKRYLKTPPFADGKNCPDCGKQIFHEKWRISPQLAEARWAHKQARQRELAEVMDFLE